MDAGSNQIPGISLPQSQAAPAADDDATDKVLDQEWVTKAKDIVEQTKADPYSQSNEIQKIKAEYMKARFGRDLNVGDGSAV